QISADRVIAKKVVSHLAKQRKETGQDDLMRRRPELVDKYFEVLLKPYRADPSKIYREFAAVYVYNRLSGRAIVAAWKGVLTRPSYFINWRTLQYCIRISLLKWLSLRVNRNKYKE